MDFVEGVGFYPGWGFTLAVGQESVLKIWPYGKFTFGKIALLRCTELNERDKFKMLGIFKSEN